MKNKEIKLPTSVENNIISIINIIEKIYKIKFTELSLLTTKIDNNTEEVRNQILEVRNLLRNQMEIWLMLNLRKGMLTMMQKDLFVMNMNSVKIAKLEKLSTKWKSKEESSINFPTTTLRKLRLKRYFQTAKVFIILRI